MECCLVEAGEVMFSERVVISDPGYRRDVWCMDDNVHIKEGVYRVFVVASDEGKFDVRIAQLLLIHESLPKDVNSILKRKWTELCNIGVDSGQAGVFDNSVYPEESLDTGEHDDPNSFYGECCALTLDTPHYGVLRNKKGFVTSSGFGDGSYSVEALYENDERVALRIDFNIVEMREVMDKLIINSNKSEFVEKCGELLCFAQPHLVKCEYKLGKEMPSRMDEHYNEDDEYVLVTCKNGHTYALLITGNSLAATGATIFSKMAHK